MKKSRLLRGLLEHVSLAPSHYPSFVQPPCMVAESCVGVISFSISCTLPSLIQSLVGNHLRAVPFEAIEGIPSFIIFRLWHILFLPTQSCIASERNPMLVCSVF